MYLVLVRSGLGLVAAVPGAMIASWTSRLPWTERRGVSQVSIPAYGRETVPYHRWQRLQLADLKCDGQTLLERAP